MLIRVALKHQPNGESYHTIERFMSEILLP